MADTTTDLVPGRSCQGCTLCCKLMEIDELAKPRGTWCSNCDRTRGCTIYESRPEACRIFYCGYLRIAHLDERWKPAKAKFLINFESRNNRIVVHCDPQRPGAWREEPFYSTIKQWAKNAVKENGMVIVWTGAQAIAVLPEKDRDLGTVRYDQVLLASTTPSAKGPSYDVIVVEPGDPRISAR